MPKRQAGTPPTDLRTGKQQPLQGLHPRRPDRSHGQYGTDAVASGRNPIRHEDTGQHAVYGIATLGANRLDVVVSNLKVGDNLNPVSVVVFDNDAMEGLNLPNNLKASAAKRMEQGLVQNIDMPLSSIGTMASEVTSVVNATTQVAKQILNMSLSQVKVHLKSNYEMYIQEESQESKLRRQAVQAELQKLYEQMEQEKTNKKIIPFKH